MGQPTSTTMQIAKIASQEVTKLAFYSFPDLQLMTTETSIQDTLIRKWKLILNCRFHIGS